EISRNVSNTLDLAQVLPRILESLFTIFPQADRGFILLRDPASGQLVPRAVRHRREQPNSTALPLSRTVLEHAINEGPALLSPAAGSDARFDLSQSVRAHSIRSVMCVPLLSQAGANLGVLQLDAQRGRNQFQQEDLDVLAFASVQAAQAVDLANLHLE